MQGPPNQRETEILLYGTLKRYSTSLWSINTLLYTSSLVTNNSSGKSYKRDISSMSLDSINVFLSGLVKVHKRYYSANVFDQLDLQKFKSIKI